MSLPLSYFEWWQTGTAQPSIPVNNNALRTMISMKSAVSDSVTAQPSLSTPDDDGLWYVIPSGATGPQWSTFEIDSCAIFYGGAWYEFVPEDGDIVVIQGDICEYSPSNGWVAIATGGGSSDTVEIVTVSGTSATISPSTHGGVHKYVRCTNAGLVSLTFNSGQGYAAGDVFNIRAVGAAGVLLVESGVALTEPYGGTLQVPQNGTVTVIMTSGTEGDVMGVTEPAS